jgi:hypothetical protein
MTNEIKMLLEQRDICRRLAAQAADAQAQATFLEIAEQYDVSAAAARARHSVWNGLEATPGR